jgi:hypothetical protein
MVYPLEGGEATAPRSEIRGTYNMTPHTQHDIYTSPSFAYSLTTLIAFRQSWSTGYFARKSTVIFRGLNHDCVINISYLARHGVGATL